MMAADSNDGKDVGWYTPTLETIPAGITALLTKYSGVPSEKVESHILDVRERAWRICPYPCIGQFRFLDLSITQHPQWEHVLGLLRGDRSTRVLDLGCCFGQDSRALAFAGVEWDQIRGAELRQEFVDLGYDLFLDRQQVPDNTFLGGVNVFAAEGVRLLSPWKANLDVVYASSFFHLFSWDDQIKAAKVVVDLLKPKAGSIVLGRQVGNDNAQSFERGASGLRDRGRGESGRTDVYRHNPESWRRMWTQIGQETGTEWDVNVEMSDWEEKRSNNEDQAWRPEGMKRIWYWVVRR